jgi:DNA-directed RNA polymerase specialized sigma24 family protein
MPPDEELPPELRAVSKAEFREVYTAATRLALALMKDRDRADLLVSDTFEKLLTTRRWDPKTKPLLDHVLSSVMSIRSNTFRSKARARDDVAHEGFQREEAGMEAESPEAKTLARAKEEGAQADAEAELDALGKSVEKHALAPRVLACRRAGKTKRAEIADELGVSPEEVSLANDVLRDHLRKIRARRDKKGGEE